MSSSWQDGTGVRYDKRALIAARRVGWTSASNQELRFIQPVRRAIPGVAAGLHWPLFRGSKAHWYERNNGRVVEKAWRQTGPVTQALAAGIVPWHAAVVNAGARHLTDNDNARCGTELDDRARPSGKRTFSRCHVD